MEKKYAQDSRHVIVSGGSKGLGLAICRDLLNQGYSVSTFSRSKSQDIDMLSQNYGDFFYYESVDAKNKDALNNFVQRVENQYTRLYGLINNAAVVQEGVLATLPEVEIEKMLTVNLEAVLFLTRLFLRPMLTKPHEQGRILNMSSIVGTRGYSGLVVYSATKAALDGMTRSLARELGSRNITVNSIAPGYLKSDLSASLTEEQLEQIKRRTSLGRLAETKDITPLVRFLLSDEASFITGQTILVDGGLSS